VTDRAERAADTFTPWTAEEEQQIGEAAAEKMVALFGLTNAPELQRYVNLVGAAVARYASRELPWRFGVLNTEIVGAYALPGGYIFITRGSLASMSNEAQLAGALGHEIEHAAARHLESEIRSRKTSSWMSEEALAKTKQGQQLVRLRADAVLKDLFSTALSRSKEDDADEQGSRMAAACGFAGNGLLEFIQVLAMESADPTNRRLFGQLLATHPSFDDRVARLSSLATNRSKGKTLEARFARALGR
jgi:predicted Zn-dependent protease